ncbi:uncharacterized protein M6B38_136335 [Iris pallida]|uniref:Uncharacterized protein n=1 Tax=Iris pallida TaxID=29817 RepID=A0AAX6FF75_IRIPA|nr:uncharacterized protein M6B38_136335 [Iris pallida]
MCDLRQSSTGPRMRTEPIAGIHSFQADPARRSSDPSEATAAFSDEPGRRSTEEPRPIPGAVPSPVSPSRLRRPSSPRHRGFPDPAPCFSHGLGCSHSGVVQAPLTSKLSSCHRIPLNAPLPAPPRFGAGEPRRARFSSVASTSGGST